MDPRRRGMIVRSTVLGVIVLAVAVGVTFVVAAIFAGFLSLIVRG